MCPNAHGHLFAHEHTYTHAGASSTHTYEQKTEPKQNKVACHNSRSRNDQVSARSVLANTVTASMPQASPILDLVSDHCVWYTLLNE